jgi:hypothetical protein
MRRGRMVDVTQINGPIRIVVGAGPYERPGWILTQREQLDLVTYPTAKACGHSPTPEDLSLAGPAALTEKSPSDRREALAELRLVAGEARLNGSGPSRLDPL